MYDWVLFILPSHVGIWSSRKSEQSCARTFSLVVVGSTWVVLRGFTLENVSAADEGPLVFTPVTVTWRTTSVLPAYAYLLPTQYCLASLLQQLHAQSPLLFSWPTYNVQVGFTQDPLEKHWKSVMFITSHITPSCNCSVYLFSFGPLPYKQCFLQAEREMGWKL